MGPRTGMRRVYSGGYYNPNRYRPVREQAMLPNEARNVNAVREAVGI
jgi:hypothetical protein